MTLLEVINLMKSFGGVQAVDGCSFAVAKGSITALIGPNGAGKTTVFNLISGLVAVHEGAVFLSGRELTKLPAHQRARAGLSRTFQMARLFKNLTIADHLQLALNEKDDSLFASGFARDPESNGQKMREILELVGLDKPINTLSSELSYGQRKLLDLARALAKPHQLLMLDEPVAGVNPVLRDRFKALLKELKSRGETILVIEHDMDFVRAVADRVIVMDQGRVLAEGEPERALSDKRVLEAYLGR